MNKLSYFKIGLFVISATVLAVIGIIVLGVGSVFQRAALVETYIEESVQGLDIGSPMKFRGVLVGKGGGDYAHERCVRYETPLCSRAHRHNLEPVSISLGGPQRSEFQK